MQTSDTSYYLTTALQALQSAAADNHDQLVATQLSRAMDALQHLAHQMRNTASLSSSALHDPYEMDLSNSAI